MRVNQQAIQDRVIAEHAHEVHTTEDAIRVSMLVEEAIDNAYKVRQQANVVANIVPIPPWITSERGVRQFRLGVFWFHHSQETNERVPGPLTMRYLLDNLRWMSEKGLFSGSCDEWAIVELSFVLGMLSQEQ